MSLTKTLVGAALGVGVLGLSTLGASAAVVCTGNACWHAHENMSIHRPLM